MIWCPDMHHLQFGTSYDDEICEGKLQNWLEIFQTIRDYFVVLLSLLFLSWRRQFFFCSVACPFTRFETRALPTDNCDLLWCLLETSMLTRHGRWTNFVVNCWKFVRCGILIVQPLDILHCHFSTSEMIFRVITLFSPSTTSCFHKQIDDVISFRLLVPVKCSNMFELIIHGCLFFHELHDLNDFCWNYFNDFNCACPLFWLHFVFSRMRACCLFFLVHSLSPPTVVKAMVYLLLGDVQKIADECGFPQHTLAKHFPSRG